MKKMFYQRGIRSIRHFSLYYILYSHKFRKTNRYCINILLTMEIVYFATLKIKQKIYNINN